ncbi:MAG: hypothetical protein AB1758_09845 [Candidatus Eremiobacterota bacterium]
MLLKVCVAILLLSVPALATPEFSRRYKVESCNVCHTVVPKLNERGMDFQARGYRPDPLLNLEEQPTVPLSVWLTQNVDRRLPKDVDNHFTGKVEVISGGTLGDSLNYFVEWRALSLESKTDGTLRDRSGRFEDLWVSWKIDPRWSLTLGQYRPLLQVEPGRKLSIGTNVLYDLSLPGEKADTARKTGLRSFSTNGRSPGFTLSYQSVSGEQAMDGLFHQVTVPFPGEFSLPLTAEARHEASFELEGAPKGVVLETYYRRGLNSIGAHGFVDSNRWMAVLLGELNFGDLYATAGVGLDDVRDDKKPLRVRSSLELEYLPTLEDQTWRPGVGLRLENVSHSGHPVVFVPYAVLASPNLGEFTSLLQLEYRTEPGGERLRLDYSVMF